MISFKTTNTLYSLVRSSQRRPFRSCQLDKSIVRLIHYEVRRRSDARLFINNKLQVSKKFNLISLRHLSQVEASSEDGARSKVQPMILPDIGEGIVEVLIKDWHVKVGDTVKEFDGLCDVESDKATATISSRFGGVITKIHYDSGAVAPVGQPLVDIETLSRVTDTREQRIKESSVSDKAPLSNTKEKNESFTRLEEETIPIALPSVRRLAKQHGIDLRQVKATGRDGRLVLMEDLQAFISNIELGGKTSNSSNNKSQASLKTENWLFEKGLDNKRETKVPLGSMTKAMFKTMTQSLKIPHFNHSDELDMTKLVDLVRDQKDSGKVKVSQLAFIIKMVSLALMEYPQLNASVDEHGEVLTIKHYHNIGVAMDTAAGLIVPNIKSVENLGIVQIMSQLERLRELAYSSKLGFKDLSGATITLSNIGSIGGVFGVPVLVTPEIVIGALGRVRRLPRFNSSGQVEARHVMQLVWSADHRCVDGASLARFNNLLKSFIENPQLALVHMR